MTPIPKVQLTQPRVEKIHKCLEGALDDISELTRYKDFIGDNGWVKRLESLEYLVQSAKDYLPPKQLPLDF